MSVACPCTPPMSWWMRMREWGRAKRFPGSPADRRTAAMLAAWPMQRVEIFGFTYCMVS